MNDDKLEPRELTHLELADHKLTPRDETLEVLTRPDPPTGVRPSLGAAPSTPPAAVKPPQK